MGISFMEGPNATPWGIALFCLYLFGFLVAVVEVGLICSAGARLRSFHGAFLCLALAFLPLRLAILSLSMPSGAETVAEGILIIVYFLPTCLQFAAFSLWGLFLHVASQRHMGLAATKPVLVWYFASNGLLAVANLAEIAVAVFVAHENTLLRTVFHVQNAFRGTVYGILAAVVAVYGWQFARLPEYVYKRTLLPSRPGVLAVINGVLVFVFGARTVYDFVTLVQVWHLPPFPPVVPSVFCFFVLVELVPLLLLLGVFSMPLLASMGRGGRKASTSNVWDDRFIDNPARSSSQGGSTSDGRSGRVYDSGMPYGDEADLFLYATDDSIRRGLMDTPTTGTLTRGGGDPARSAGERESFTTSPTEDTSRELDSISSR